MGPCKEMTESNADRNCPIVIWDGLFSIPVPEHWTTDEDESISLYDPVNGVGAVTISVYRRQAGPSPTADEALRLLRQFAKGHGIRLDRASVEAKAGRPGTSAHAQGIQRKHRSFWEIWQFVRCQTLVLMTYNCDLDARDVDEWYRALLTGSFAWDGAAGQES